MRVALALFMIVAAAPAWAEQPYEGSWAADAARCQKPDDGNIRITGNRYFEHEGSCKIGKATKSGASFSLTLSCEGEGETWTKTVEVKPRGDRGSLDLNGNPLIRCRGGTQPPNWPSD